MDSNGLMECLDKFVFCFGAHLGHAQSWELLAMCSDNVYVPREDGGDI